MPRTWFITGCSSGFGRLLANELLRAGDRVVATARRLEALEALRLEAEGASGGPPLCLQLDVTHEPEIVSAVHAAVERFGRIDVLVNNAGYGYFAAQEEFEMDEVRRVFETNVFGLARMTAEVLPRFRAQEGGGHVVNLSSIGGRIASPRGGFYQATKWAVEALSESLYYETADFGVKVIVIEPGSYETDFGPRSAHRSPHLADPASPYAALKEKWDEAGGKIFAPRQNPVEVVHAIRLAVESGIPFQRIPVGRDAVEMIGAREGRPDVEFIEYMRQRSGLGVPRPESSSA